MLCVYVCGCSVTYNDPFFLSQRGGSIFFLIFIALSFFRPGFLFHVNPDMIQTSLCSMHINIFLFLLHLLCFSTWAVCSKKKKKSDLHFQHLWNTWPPLAWSIICGVPHFRDVCLFCVFLCTVYPDPFRESCHACIAVRSPIHVRIA